MPVNCWISDFIFSCLSLAAGFFKDDLQGAWSKFSKRIWPSLGMIALLFGLVLLGQIFSNLLMGILYQIVNLTKEKGLNQATVERLLTNRQLFLPAVFSIVVTGPFVEELVFRKSLMDTGRKFMSILLIIILQALLFAAIHMHALQISEFISVIPQLITALIWGIFYSKTDQIFYPVTVHILINTIGILLVCLIWDLLKSARADFSFEQIPI